jgi:hypothetical protein
MRKHCSSLNLKSGDLKIDFKALRIDCAAAGKRHRRMASRSLEASS